MRSPPIRISPAVGRSNPAIMRSNVGRDLRQAGSDVGTDRANRRAELPEPERGFVVEFAVPLAQAGKTWRALVACRHQAGAIEREVIDSLKARLSQVPAEAGLVF